MCMAKVSLWLDSREKKDGTRAVKICITSGKGSSYIPTDFSVKEECWDANKQQVIRGPRKEEINNQIRLRLSRVEQIVMRMLYDGEASGKNAKEIKEYVLDEIDPVRKKRKITGNLFAARFIAFAELHKPQTREIYMHTYKRIEAFMQGRMEDLSFEDIDRRWLTRFDLFMQHTSPSKNARNIHLRNIRAVFNDALDDEIITCYPFRRFKIRPVSTPKRSLSVEQLRQFMTCECDDTQRHYRDAFMLIFLLCGINITDLCNLRSINDGRIEYNRAKTGRLYSIKVEPEAMDIIERYRGKNYLLGIMDRYKSHEDYMRRINRALQTIGNNSISERGKKIYDPMFPHITTYWARHTWATIAASLDVPKETIAAGLGHGGNTVTDIYIDFDMRKVDEANRRVIDWVYYGIR